MLVVRIQTIQTDTCSTVSINDLWPSDLGKEWCRVGGWLVTSLTRLRRSTKVTLGTELANLVKRFGQVEKIPNEYIAIVEIL